MLLNLSDREKEVLQLWEQGLSYKEIGTGLKISEHTVKTYCQRIILKTYCNSMRVAAYLRRNNPPAPLRPGRGNDGEVSNSTSQTK